MSFDRHRPVRRGAALRIALAYLLVGCCWILFSDMALEALVPDPRLQATLQTYKGWFYVVVTATLLFGLAAHQLSAAAKAQRRLFETRDKFHSAFEKLPLPVHGYDERGRAVFWNEACERIYGYRREEMLGRTLMQLVMGGVEDAEEIKDQVLSNSPHERKRTTMVAKSGTLLTVESSRLLLNLPGGGRELLLLDIVLPDGTPA